MDECSKSMKYIKSWWGIVTFPYGLTAWYALFLPLWVADETWCACSLSPNLHIQIKFDIHRLERLASAITHRSYLIEMSADANLILVIRFPPPRSPARCQDSQHLSSTIDTSRKECQSFRLHNKLFHECLNTSNYTSLHVRVYIPVA